MNKIELETIALACLERLETEATTARQNQDEKIRKIETRVEDFERQLTRLSASLLSLQPLANGLNSMLLNAEDARARKGAERQSRGMSR